MPKSEAEYQTALIKKIKKRIPGSIVLKNDSGYQQGIPDLGVFADNFWAFLEVKKSEDEEFEPNQEYFVDRANQMSYGATIYPENEKQVLDDLQHAYASRQVPCPTKSQ